MFDFLKDLSASELIALREHLNNMNFIDISKLCFARVSRDDICETYANVDLGGYRRHETLEYSEVFLVDTDTKCDVFTGEDFEGKWGGNDGDGFMGGYTTVELFSEDGGRLSQCIEKYDISCEPFYCNNEIDKLLKVYNECTNKFVWHFYYREKTLKNVPYRKYEIVENKVKALKPLQYITMYDSRKQW